MTSPDIDDQLNSLYSLQRKGIKLGLEHTVQLLNFLGNPDKKLTLIHVAGTNGKGSTCAHLQTILRAHGYKVGLYTSPHLIKFNERIRINGAPISDEEIISFMRSIDSAINKIDSTFFEVTTAMALNHFNEYNVDVAIIETGLGGRLDSTNVIKPNLTMMTPISMDHMEILGDSIEKIAKEKSGIIKDGVVLITAKQNKVVADILFSKASEKNTSVIVVDMPSNISITPRGTDFILNNQNYNTPLIGKVQAENASLAISALKHFNNQITYETICDSFKELHWPGRLQLLSKGIYYDVAHNSSGIQTTLRCLHDMYPEHKLYGLFCLKGDKDLKSIAVQLKGKFKRLFVAGSNHRLINNPKQLSKKLNNHGIKNYPIESIKNGVELLRRGIKKRGIGIIFGTHYIAEEVFKEFEISFDSGII